ncbi:hypothetical protein B0H14DRAFT_3876949 [Mycena olivaceomarginata]|nr:hypothetical protein B0H14DRAFT_3876949 [Mycena olivaceomarginata]
MVRGTCGWALCAHRGVTVSAHCERVTQKHWQMRRHRAVQGSDCSPNSHLPGYYVSVAGQGGAPAEKWQREDRPALPAARRDDRDEWHSVQGARVGMGTGQRYSVTLCLARHSIGGQAAPALVWCRGAASRRADYGVWKRGGVARPARCTYAGNAGGSTGCAASKAAQPGSAMHTSHCQPPPACAHGSLVVTPPPVSHAAAPAQRLSASALISAQPPMYGEMFDAYLTAANSSLYIKFVVVVANDAEHV